MSRQFRKGSRQNFSPNRLPRSIGGARKRGAGRAGALRRPAPYTHRALVYRRFPTGWIADFPIGWPNALVGSQVFGWHAGWETCDTAGLEVGGTDWGGWLALIRSQMVPILKMRVRCRRRPRPRDRGRNERGGSPCRFSPISAIGRGAQLDADENRGKRSLSPNLSAYPRVPQPFM